jgi:hypothetical protein
MDLRFHLTIDDYVEFFGLTYRCHFTDEYLAFYRLTDQHNYFQKSSQITDKSRSQMLEIILFVEANT